MKRSGGGGDRTQERGRGPIVRIIGKRERGGGIVGTGLILVNGRVARKGASLTSVRRGNESSR